ncbi:polyprenyl synthetase family protein [Paenibacillus graminis]|uniref:polyprenyl synthetase family protein n=2 Tax=Paenibacillus graminis TaxID=189425 RepID=UPI002DBC3ED4|nr:polyprenyl synthetase family protein [Paenibacillus graminis]MEC0167176.1 polyprenyl synthetase family protein [Paenibacillus graminis]
MNKNFTEQGDTVYQCAEHKAAQYFAALYKQVMDKTYVPILTKDIQLWKKNHIPQRSWMAFFTRGKRAAVSRDYQKYLEWLNYTGKLDDYLDRSVSYIYMRDLGKALDDSRTKTRIQRVVTDLKGLLMHSGANEREDQPGLTGLTSLAGFYRWAQKEGIESAAIWVIDKLKNVSSHIPEEMDAEQAERKLIKIIVGVILHVIEEMDEQTTSAERAHRLDEAIRIGYSYGLTYPFIDDLLDSQVLKAPEKEQYSAMIRTALLTGNVPELSEWPGVHLEIIQYVHTELKAAFEYIKSLQKPETEAIFFEQSYVFFHSQDIDRNKDLAKADYTNEELYIPVILKSSSSRLIVRSVISASEDKGFDERTFFYGIYNQLADDFADMYDDMRDGAVTPYTYYLKYRKQRPDLINPYELYWTVISYLIHNVYHSDAKTLEVMIDRAINGLKRCKERVGTEQYNEIMEIFASGNPEFNRLIQLMVRKADDVDFFDKLLRDQINTQLKNDRMEKEKFQTTIRTVRDQINDLLKIPRPAGIPPMKESLIEAANYSLTGDGKRIRPILTWVLGVEVYGLQSAAIEPLLRSLEFMHTASLIFDDLPSQDNAPTRRGRPTLHQVHNSATAELTGLYLIQKAIQEQASLQAFNPVTVLALMQYSAEKAEDMCMGQAMDLHSKGKAMTLEQLNMMCFYKTGLAFEASLVMPAILAGVQSAEIEALKKFAYHAGIAFQIKDDLLDLEGDHHLLGKNTRMDVENNNSTFVSVLGPEAARIEMWDHYCHAVEALNAVPRKISFLNHLLDYIINRNR